jgi:chemotaxis response regulator CheB
MAKRIDEETPRFEDPDSLDAQVREYMKIKTVIETMESRQKELRAKLMESIDVDGFEDGSGNLQLELPAAVEGVMRLEKQRRVSRKLNEPKAEEILQQLGLYDDIFVMKPTLDEDALMAAFYEEKISEEELDEMFPANVTWALRTLKK